MYHPGMLKKMDPSEKFNLVYSKECLPKRYARVYTKNEKWVLLWKILDRILRVLTLGKNKTFLTQYTTTIGKYIFFPAGFDDTKATEKDVVTLRHELTHVRQYYDFGLGDPWVGCIPFALLYLFLPLPVILAWFRYDLEREAYFSAWEAVDDLQLNYKPNVTDYVDILAGPTYVWAFPFKKAILDRFLGALKKK